MEIYQFKETLLEFLSDVTTIPDKGKNWFLDKEDAKEPFDAPNGYKVLSPYVLVKITTSTKIPDRPRPMPASGEKTIEEKIEEEIFHCIVNFRIYTEAHVYAISATWKDYTPQYLGCIASTRKHKVGEDWTRGNDLPDGHFCRETWEHIKNAMIHYEMKAISKYIVNGRWHKPFIDESTETVVKSNIL